MFPVMEVRSVSVGHENDVWFPSEDDRENFGDGNERLVLPAELFGKQGICFILLEKIFFSNFFTSEG